MVLTTKDENILKKKLFEIDNVLDSIDKELKEQDKMFVKINYNITEARKELQTKEMYFHKQNIGRPFGMHFHDCEMTYQ